MKVKVKHLRQLLLELGKKTGHSIDKNGLQDIGIKIGLTPDYLYKNIDRKINSRKDDDELNPHNTVLNDILKFLQFDSFQEFVESLDRALSTQLASCEGTYYSYVRRNSEEVGVLFRSPVKMWVDANRLRFELRGPASLLRGTVQLKHDCLFILMEAADGEKAFHHVYKLGTRKRPDVLQGIFSGVSTAFHPIGGRAVLVRNEGSYEKLENAELEIEKIKKSKLLEERRLAYYFEKYFNNNVKSDISSTFGLGDLGNCK